MARKPLQQPGGLVKCPPPAMNSSRVKPPRAQFPPGKGASSPTGGSADSSTRKPFQPGHLHAFGFLSARMDRLDLLPATRRLFVVGYEKDNTSS